jgi:hypothetical protein
MTGIDGDYYLNTVSGEMFQKQNGSWVSIGTLMGPQGAKGDKGDQGIQGEQGTQGLQGNAGAKGDKGDTGDAGVPQKWYSGAVNPT